MSAADSFENEDFSPDESSGSKQEEKVRIMKKYFGEFSEEMVGILRMIVEKDTDKDITLDF